MMLAFLLEVGRIWLNFAVSIREIHHKMVTFFMGQNLGNKRTPNLVIVHIDRPILRGPII